FLVTNTADSGPGSLRQAILNANASSNSLNPGGVPDVIRFAIPGSGVQTITPLTSLPDITDPVVVDGYSQPGSHPNTLTDGANAALLIELNGGPLSPGFNGLTLDVGNSTVRGLIINGFQWNPATITGGAGIFIQAGRGAAGVAVGGNLVTGNFLGTDSTGT